MRIIVSDASVLFDLADPNLLLRSFRLPYEFQIADVMFAEELSSFAPDFCEALVEAGLVVARSDGDEVLAAIRLRERYRALSTPDAFALLLARREGAILLTGDRRLRNAVTFKRRTYRGRRRSTTRRFRLVGVRDLESALYRFYLTNIAPEVLDAHAIAQVYAARWQVELAFGELKSHYRLDSIPSAKAATVEALVLASLITMRVSKQLLEAVRHRLKEQARRLREERWAALLSSVAADVLDVVLLSARAAGVLARRLEPMLLYEAVDPNTRRQSLLQRVDQETVWSR